MQCFRKGKNDNILKIKQNAMKRGSAGKMAGILYAFRGGRSLKPRKFLSQ